MPAKLVRFALAVGLAILLAFGSNLPHVAVAQAPGLVISTSYPNIIAELGKAISLPIKITNNASTAQSVDLTVTAPEGWQPILKSGGHIVRSAYVVPGEPTDITFEVTPPENAEPQDYNFAINATGPAGTSTLNLVIGIQQQPIGGLQLTTDYPEQQGPATNQFEFSVDLANKTSADQSVDLSATPPQNWQVIFKPSFGDKQIATLQVKAGQSETLNVNVTPLRTAEPGEYQIPIVVSAGGEQTELVLKVTITGQPAIELSTPSGLLNTNATAGAEQTVSFVVTNTGSTPLNDISLSSSPPSGWKVTFSPDKIASLGANEAREVNATIQPDAQALAGDYSMSVTASSSGASDSKDLRVTVATPTTWGWIGISIVGVVFAGLYGMFRVLSRR